jgi:hypothetical protein
VTRSGRMLLAGCDVESLVKIVTALNGSSYGSSVLINYVVHR